ncbi:pituitary homeobox 1 [Striga asiatica]|uniref:Pituitary homeobox 1 n=1 Tax=Striga asiatica TaxID=4170 RepID=A0A5A7PTI6_STRAF|nr:pituitary homeobox 1 [Striga asiatica]
MPSTPVHLASARPCIPPIAVQVRMCSSDTRCVSACTADLPAPPAHHLPRPPAPCRLLVPETKRGCTSGVPARPAASRGTARVRARALELSRGRVDPQEIQRADQKHRGNDRCGDRPPPLSVQPLQQIPAYRPPVCATCGQRHRGAGLVRQNVCCHYRRLVHMANDCPEHAQNHEQQLQQDHEDSILRDKSGDHVVRYVDNDEEPKKERSPRVCSNHWLEPIAKLKTKQLAQPKKRKWVPSRIHKRHKRGRTCQQDVPPFSPIIQPNQQVPADPPRDRKCPTCDSKPSP